MVKTSKEEVNEILHHLWWIGRITVKRHCDTYWKLYKEYPYNCTFKSDWLAQYYDWLYDHEEIKGGIKDA
mgnify:FL=1